MTRGGPRPGAGRPRVRHVALLVSADDRAALARLRSRWTCDESEAIRRAITIADSTPPKETPQ